MMLYIFLYIILTQQLPNFDCNIAGDDKFNFFKCKAKLLEKKLFNLIQIKQIEF